MFGNKDLFIKGFNKLAKIFPGCFKKGWSSSPPPNKYKYIIGLFAVRDIHHYSKTGMTTFKLVFSVQ